MHQNWATPAGKQGGEAMVEEGVVEVVDTFSGGFYDGLSTYL